MNFGILKQAALRVQPAAANSGAAGLIGNFFKSVEQCGQNAWQKMEGMLR